MKEFVALAAQCLNRRAEVNRIQRLVESNQEQILESWNEFFRG